MDNSLTVVNMKKSIVLAILFTLGTHLILSNVATADETGTPDEEAAETLDSTDVSNGDSAAECAQELSNPLAAMIGPEGFILRFTVTLLFPT
jgi:hypothetical protein